MREDKLILACRVIGGTLLAGVFAVATGLIESRTYLNEVEYTRESREEAKRFKQHRCNDRLADMLEIAESDEGSMWRDLRPTFNNWWACMRSAEGHEPSMPYIMLTPRDKKYISPEARQAKRAQAQEVQLPA